MTQLKYYGWNIRFIGNFWAAKRVAYDVVLKDIEVWFEGPLKDSVELDDTPVEEDVFVPESCGEETAVVVVISDDDVVVVFASVIPADTDEELGAVNEVDDTCCLG